MSSSRVLAALLLSCALVGALGRELKQDVVVGADCASLGPQEFLKCCSSKSGWGVVDHSCDGQLMYEGRACAAWPTPTKTQCCAYKASKQIDDKACPAPQPQPDTACFSDFFPIPNLPYSTYPEGSANASLWCQQQGPYVVAGKVVALPNQDLVGVIECVKPGFLPREPDAAGNIGCRNSGTGNIGSDNSGRDNRGNNNSGCFNWGNGNSGASNIGNGMSGGAC